MIFGVNKSALTLSSNFQNLSQLYRMLNTQCKPVHRCNEGESELRTYVDDQIYV